MEDETQSRSGRERDKKNPCTCRKSNAGFSAHDVVTTLTELPADLLLYKVSAGLAVPKLIANQIRAEGLIHDGRNKF
jgi:hypothetical protein